MRVRNLKRWAVAVLLFTAWIIWIFIVRERRESVLSVVSAHTYGIRKIFSAEHCLVDYMDNLPSENPKKIILYQGYLGPGMNSIMQFDGCEYSNCILQYCNDVKRYAHRADAIIFDYNSIHVSMKLPQNILRFVYCAESQAMWFNRWSRALNDLNGTMTYWQSSSPGSFAFGRTIPLKLTDSRPKVTNYALNKTKGAFAYVSNCRHTSYDRIDIMNQLSKYVDVDVFGRCTGINPCPEKFEPTCVANLHAKYRFYLAFENSLCKEYITEKFWKGLESTEHFVPVALGGLSVKEYAQLAPPNSFIHAYNFTSIEQLGLYLNSLMTDDAAYNRYHEWRQNYVTSMSAKKEDVCSYCKALNHPEVLQSNRDRHFADEWNKPENCRKWS